MSALPLCQDCHSNTWQRLLGESDQAWMFGCLHCKTRQVVSKPPIKQAARAHQEARRIAEVTNLLSQQEKRRRYFT